MSARSDVGDVISAAALREWPLPQPGGSKRTRGRVVVVGGSPSTPGAAMLAGLAALRVGAGILSLAVARSVAGPVAAAVPEASVAGLPELDGDADPEAVLPGAVAGSDAIVIGPGLDDPKATEVVLRQVLGAAEDTSLVLDAFTLGVLADFDAADRIRGRSVLTPNSAEASRLLAADNIDDRDGLTVAVEIAELYGAAVSYQSYVAEPGGRRWTVPVGHAGLGTSGSGDVLAGAVGGLLARGADPAQAACWATYLHSTAGDRLAARVGRLGFLARELVDQLPFVIVETEA